MARSLKKTIVVTGGSKGIGFGLCREFLKLGCNVSFCSRKEADIAVCSFSFSTIPQGEDRDPLSPSLMIPFPI